MLLMVKRMKRRIQPTYENSARADLLAKALEDVGAIVEVESDQDALRVTADSAA
jgi:hypothetical protein